MWEFTMNSSWCVGKKIRAENLVSHCKLHYTVRVEVKRAQPCEISFPLPYRVTLRRMADLRGCNWSVSGISSWAWFKRFLAAAWLSIHHADLCRAWTGPVTLRWPTDCSMGDGVVNTGTVIYFNSLCVCRRLSGGTFMLILYNMHLKSHLIPHCKINLILPQGCFIYKGACLVCPTCVKEAPCRINVSIHWVLVELSDPGQEAVTQD